MDEYAECPECQSETGPPMGTLGDRTWIRCRFCGWLFSVEPEIEDVPRVTREELREAQAVAEFVREQSGVDEDPPWEMTEWDVSPEPYEPNPYDGTYSEE